jgi:hypothetical protein
MNNSEQISVVFAFGGSDFVFLGWIVLTLWALAHVIIHQPRPIAKILWSLMIICFPIFGALIYLILCGKTKKS